jgi:choline dehydrogenase-like flavoprotein
MSDDTLPPHAPAYDCVVVGSGFGGAMVAHELIRSGCRVLMLERGGWVERGEQCWNDIGGFFQRTPAYTMETAYQVSQRRPRAGGAVRWERQGICACVGGPSVFYGGASFRFRERDFAPPPEIVAGSGAAWPITYGEMEPFYARAERLLGVAGAAGEDPTEPPRSAAYPAAPAPLSLPSRRVAAAARSLGLTPFPIPLALNRSPERGPVCAACTTCDGFACAIGAKNDLSHLVARLREQGLELRTDTVVVRVVVRGGRAVGVECVERSTGRRSTVYADRVVLAAGALASPHLLLASGAERLNPGGHTVGRFLMRHCNAFVYGVFLAPPNPDGTHHKQVAIQDFYFGDPEDPLRMGKLGNLQQVMAPPPGALPRPARLAWTVDGIAAPTAHRLFRHATGLLAIAEDQPRLDNGVAIDRGASDRFGLPRLRVTHHYSERDEAARQALVRRARQILRVAGARFTRTFPVPTFSHAVGTVRMGDDPAASALDRFCAFRGVENLYVVDGSFMPTAAGLNPSLTIAANALRVGEHLAAA